MWRICLNNGRGLNFGMTGGVRAHPFKIDVLQNRDLSVIVAEASEHIIKGWP